MPGCSSAALMRGYKSALLLLLLAASCGPALSLRCYSGDVETALAEPIDGYEVFGLDCGVTQSSCVSRNYTLTSYRLECYTGNCSRVGNRGQELDSRGLNSFVCCSTDFCNTLGNNARLNAVNLVSDVGDDDQEVQRPTCPGAFREWLYGEYRVLTDGEVYSTTQASELQGLVNTVTDDLRSEYTFGIQPPTVKEFIFSRDPSQPGCYTVSGFVKVTEELPCTLARCCSGKLLILNLLEQEGFCGPRNEHVISGEDTAQVSITTREVFDGKYQGKVCVGSKTEAISYAQDFTVVAKDNNFDTCFSSLISSTLTRDCLAMGGVYNVNRLDVARRTFYPDCCSIYIHVTAAVRAQCNCNALSLGPICSNVCCCESAMSEEDEDEMCPKMASYISTQLELEAAVNKQCCESRMVSQCSSGSECRDEDFSDGKLDRLHAAQMCCDYCEDFYNEVCSYDGVQDGANVFIEMKEETRYPLLQEVCRQKECSDRRPCSFTQSTT